MIFDYTDPIGAIQTIVSIIILVEIIQFMDKDDWSAHIQERAAFYSGIFGKVGGFLKSAFEGFQIIFSRIFSRKEKESAFEGFQIIFSRIFSRKEKDQKEDHEHDPKWTRKEYFEHIHEKHPDIWEQFLEEGEGAIWKNYKEDGGIEG